MDTPTLLKVWPEIVQSVSEDSPGDRARGMLGMVSPQGLLGSTLVLNTASNSVKTYFDTHLNAPVARHAARHIGSAVTVALSVDPSLDLRAEEPVVDIGDAIHRLDQGVNSIALSLPEPRTAEQDVLDGRKCGLHPNYTFDTFVRGTSNMLAHAAATAVAEQPAVSYNPLVIHGASGLGKTHLLHAIGWYTRQMYPDHIVRYVTSEEFTNQFINSIQHDKGEVFKDRYRKVDLLLVDDIQFLSGKTQTQEEFFHTFNTLHQNQKQIVVTSDVAPGRIPGFVDRLKSRFEWGLLADVQVPDLETRIAIVRKKAAYERIDIPAEVVELIASSISTNIRELEGALTRVTACANVNRIPIDLAMAQDVLKDLISDTARPEITVALIMSETASYYSVSVDELRSASRARHITNARQIAIYITRELTELSLPKIGNEFGGRDHTTVMHADRKIRKAMIEQRTTYDQVKVLTMRIRSAAR